MCIKSDAKNRQQYQKWLFSEANRDGTVVSEPRVGKGNTTPRFHSLFLILLSLITWCKHVLIMNIHNNITSLQDTNKHLHNKQVASHGDTLVVEWGVARYWRKNSYNSCFQFLPSRWAILMDFSRVCTRRSASPFALGQYGVILLCLNPRYSEKCLNSWPLNVGPLSLFRTSVFLLLEND